MENSLDELNCRINSPVRISEMEDQKEEFPQNTVQEVKRDEIYEKNAKRHERKAKRRGRRTHYVKY